MVILSKLHPILFLWFNLFFIPTKSSLGLSLFLLHVWISKDVLFDRRLRTHYISPITANLFLVLGFSLPDCQNKNIVGWVESALKIVLTDFNPILGTLLCKITAIFCKFLCIWSKSIVILKLIFIWKCDYWLYVT